MKLVKLSATWCGPCSALSATLQGVNHPLVESMENVDIDKQLDRAMKYRVRSIPTMVIVDEEDNVIRSLNGNQPKDKILEFLA
jgi:thioredoxin 1